MKADPEKRSGKGARGTRPQGSFTRLASLFLVAMCAFLALPVGAGASQEVVDFFGSEPSSGSLGGEFDIPGGIAVNSTGAGAADIGEVYVLDERNNRIQRFARDMHGTPAEPYDDAYRFVSAWGADVDSIPTGGTDYEICTVATQCQSSVASGGNGTAAGNGTLGSPPLSLSASRGIAVDQDTGNVYVSDAGNSRVNVYDAAGAFLRSFGYDVVDSGPGDIAGEAEQQQVTVKATGGKFSLSFEGQTTGGRGVGFVTKESNVITRVKTTSGAFKIGQGFSAASIQVPAGTEFFPRGTTITAIGPESLTLSQPSAGAGTRETELFGDDINYDASAPELEAALNALPSIGGVGGSVSVSGSPGDATGSTPYTVEFGGSLGETDVPALIASDGGLTIGSGTPSATVSEIVKGGAYEVCVAAGDVCRAGSKGDSVGEIASGAGIAVSTKGGDPATGTVLLADPGNHRVDTYKLDGSSPSSFGSATFDFEPGLGFSSYAQPTQIAVDSRGIVYASNVTTTGGNVSNSRIERYDSENANGGGVGFLAPIGAPPLDSSTSPQATEGLAVDPDSDGAGPDTDVLYVRRHAAGVLQFGPLNPPGLTVPPAASDDVHVPAPGFEFGGLAVDSFDGRLYVSSLQAASLGLHNEGVYVLGVAGGPSSASLDSVSDITPTSAVLHATINPNGPPALRYHLEYSTNGTAWTSTPTLLLGIQETPQAVSIALDPPGAGLQPNTLYHVRLVTKKGFGAPATTPELTFTTAAEGPIVETTGAPVRTATTAQLGGRINPRNSATTYRFEYGDQGPCDANPCLSTSPQAPGSGGVTELLSEEVTGLNAGTTYHYRLVGENGAPGSPSFGADMTVTTRESDAALSHGHLPGPPGSDRAYEQVNVADTGGNPVGYAFGFSEDGNRAAYEIAGGTPLSTTGSLLSLFFAERTPFGWKTKPIAPSREELVGATWFPPVGQSDLSSMVAFNTAETGSDKGILWRLSPNGAPFKLFEPVAPQKYANWYAAADNSTRTVTLLKGGELDPAFPGASSARNMYDVTTGVPKLVSILPDGTAPACGVPSGSSGAFQVGSNISHQLEGWVSADGSRVFFLSDGQSCSANPQLYVRDLESGQTGRASKPAVSGPSCRVAFLRSTPDAAFFWTRGRLSPEDSESGGCGLGSSNGDVYRYDLEDDTLNCVTCVVPGHPADVFLNENAYGPQESIAVSGDGSRVYFQSTSPLPLLPGASPAPNGSTYRVNVRTGQLRWIGNGIRPGLLAVAGNAINSDGSVIVFYSDDPSLNPLGGSDNGGTGQYYRYDDRDRSLLCVSCPQDGSAPSAPASLDQLLSLLDRQVGPNLIMVADDGTVAFSAPVSLTSADQNTPGPGGKAVSGEDVYEWRDGRQLLVSDGLTNWASPPNLQGISRSGRDIYFTAAAQYTLDALDGYQRLYDARIGGGFEFPEPPQPCPLEVCQGTPRGAPEEAPPGTGSFLPPQSRTPASKHCGKGKRKVRRGGKVRCVKHHRHVRRNHKANSNRRGSR